MYLEDYNLTMSPFQNTPDPRFFYASDQHREALAAMEYTLRLRKGIALLTGEIGSGKTTIGQIVCTKCAEDAKVIRVSHGHQGRRQLIRQILEHMGEHAGKRDSYAAMLERLRARLTEQLGLNRPVVLLVDEAQSLSDEALEELRLLTNFDQPSHKAVMIVLIGQPELRLRLRHERHAPLRQRIAMAKHLQPLSSSQIGDYIAHRLRAASADPNNVMVSFSKEAVVEIHRISGGVPRLINTTCDNCLLLASVRAEQQVTSEMVQQVAADSVPGLNDPIMVVTQTPPSLVGEH